jgi:hypothetical protein
MCADYDRTPRRKTKHGLSHVMEYGVWKQMRQRCSDKNNIAYENYGGRGISVCDRWQKSFSDFLADMGFRPSDAHTIDRKDNNGNYEPGNCRWVTRTEQNLNKRDNRLHTFRGETKPLGNLCRDAGIAHSTVRYRLSLGWPLERALLEEARLCRKTSKADRAKEIA